MITIACVLRSGGDFDAEYVERLKAGVEANCTVPHRFVCLSDIRVPCERIPLLHEWRGWWSKIELFRPNIPGDIFYLDLDTLVIGSIDDLVRIGRLAIMRDVYRPAGLQSSVMYIPEAAKREVWTAFAAAPQQIMRQMVHRGDQGFLEGLWLEKAERLQDICPGQIVSYKAHVRRSGKVPPGARVVAFHGKPRPRDMQWAMPEART